MKIRAFLAIIACKFTIKILRLMGRGGTAIPGKIALKLCPNLLGELSSGVRCVIITGTNGKTTSARIVEEIFAKSGVSYFANRSGANLINGITAEFVENSTITGKPKKNFAVIESDEAASKEVCRFISPEVVLVTNVFRDQLDRFGDVSQTLNSIITGLKNSPNATVCLNADCSLSVSAAAQIPNKIVYYGVDIPIYENPIAELSDATHCIHCKHEYEYTYHTFGHLGGFYCPSCGFRRPEPNVAVTKILNSGISSTSVLAKVFDDDEELTINLPGGYNIYNAAGALAVSECMGFDRKNSKVALSTFNCGFGRMEEFDLGNHTARMILIKNPAGCNQVLNYLTGLSEKTVFVCCLNDKTGDGTDISWIWDVNFEKLTEMGENLSDVYVSGIRAADMAVRLKYAGIPLEKLKVFDDYDVLINAMQNQPLPVIIMPTYSAMMDLRGKMSAAFGGKDFWE
ncbi:MAG: MurT ligase domain-containing protein [Oscillospiraceae bacterium]